MSHSARKDGRNRKLRVERLESREMLAGDFEIIKDLNQQFNSDGSTPNYLTAVGSTLYFTATTDALGAELWKTDGTQSGTVLVKDIAPGVLGSGPYQLTNVDGVLYFRAYSPEENVQRLWKSDGTAVGTVPIDAAISVRARYLQNVNGVLYYIDERSDTGWELWRSDGTAAGTRIVKDINPGSDGSYVRQLVSVGNTIYFSALTSTTGYELWKSDGTEAGTTMVVELFPGGESSRPGAMVNLNGVLLFEATDNVYGRELWKSDGTAAGTVLVKDIQPTGGTTGTLGSAAVLGGNVYFGANDGVHGFELWKSNGTLGGTVLVKDIAVGSDAGLSERFAVTAQITRVGSSLFFSARSGTGGQELWKTDGTTAGTVLVKAFPNDSAGYGPLSLTAVGNVLYFRASDDATGFELWRSDGTTAGTFRVRDLRAGSSGGLGSVLFNPQLTIVNGALYFRGNDGFTGTEIWKSDGTDAGTICVKNLVTGTRDSFITDPIELGGRLFFISNSTDNYSTSVWRTDGTPVGTSVVGSQDLYVNGPLVRMGTHLYFQGGRGETQGGLWRTDGTDVGTVLCVPGNSFLELTSTGNRLYFRAPVDNFGDGRLWVTDGTVAGTFALAGTQPLYPLLIPTNLTNVSGSLYFTAYDQLGGRELWTTDGTNAGTRRVKDIVPGSQGMLTHPDEVTLTNVNGQLYFNTQISGQPKALWRSDGTEAGTVKVTDSSTGFSFRYPNLISNVGGAVYFVGSDTDPNVSHYGLWTYSPTTGTAKFLFSLESQGFYPTYLSDLADVSGTLFFTISSQGNSGVKLWKSDGTTAGTKFLQDIHTIPRTNSRTSLSNVQGTLFFSAFNQLTGHELWKTDGTSAGTSLVKDFVPGYLGSDPVVLGAVNQRIVVHAASEQYGRELWSQYIGPVVTGDYTRNGIVELSDRTFWQTHFGATTGIGLQADGNNNGIVDTADYTLWRDSYIPPNADYNRDTLTTPADRTFWVANFGATTGVGLQADGNANNIVDAADYTLWRDAYVPPAAAPTIVIASAAVSNEAPAKPTAARPIASSPPRRTDLLLAARDAAFAELGDGDNSPITKHRQHGVRSGRGPKLQIPTRL